MIRSLGRRGVPVYATGTKGSFVARSRWHRVAPPEWGEDPSPATLRDYLSGVPEERMVLVPTTDDWALAVARLPAPVAARFPASLPPLGSLEALIDKGRFAAVLARLGVPHPRTVCVDPAGDPAGLPADALAGSRTGVYVGMSEYSPADRFDQHKAGIRAAGSVLKRGLEVLTGPGGFDEILIKAIAAATRRGRELAG